MQWSFDEVLARLRRRRGTGAPERSAPAPVAASAPVEDAAATAATAATADRLVAEGDLPGAIRVLTEMNRRRRDPAVEERLLDLRFDAFAEQVRADEPPPWPDAVPDLFPDEVMPVIDRADLTVETLRSGIFHHGSLLVRSLLEPAHVERLRSGIDRSFEAFDAVAEGPVPDDLAGWFLECVRCPEADRSLKRGRGAVLVVDSPAACFDLLEVFEEVGVSQLARDHFGEPPTLLGLKTTLRKVPHEAWTGDWHQDGAFMGTDIRSLNVWIALTHCGDDAPGLDVIGRRLDYLAQTGTDGALATWSVGRAVADREARGQVLRPVFDEGDALLFDHLMLHRTAIDPEMEIDRYAIETWLFSPSTYDVMTSTEEQPNPPRDQRPFWL